MSGKNLSRRELLLGMTALPILGGVDRKRVSVSEHGLRKTLGSGANALTLLYLRGSHYEMGYAHGKLCAAETRYLALEVAPRMLKGLEYTPEKADAVCALHAKHMRPEYLDELRGLADGSGVPFQDIMRFTSIPDISEWHCSFFAALGDAAKGRELIQIRALDYETEAGIQKFPALIVCQPDKGTPFVSAGWLGHCGVVTGMNAEGIAMSEIGDDWDKETDNLDGRPLNYVMRDALQFSKTLDEALAQVKNGSRTTSILYCLSSAKENRAVALKTSHTQCHLYSSKNLPFPTRPGMVYMSMGMDSPWNAKVGDYLQKAYGALDVTEAQNLMRNLKTGSLHAVVFKPASGDMYVANATETTMAYQRPYLHFNLKKALAEPFFRTAKEAKR